MDCSTVEEYCKQYLAVWDSSKELFLKPSFAQLSEAPNAPGHRCMSFYLARYPLCHRDNKFSVSDLESCIDRDLPVNGNGEEHVQKHLNPTLSWDLP